MSIFKRLGASWSVLIQTWSYQEETCRTYHNQELKKCARRAEFLKYYLGGLVPFFRTIEGRIAGYPPPPLCPCGRPRPPCESWIFPWDHLSARRSPEVLCWLLLCGLDRYPSLKRKRVILKEPIFTSNITDPKQFSSEPSEVIQLGSKWGCMWELFSGNQHRGYNSASMCEVFDLSAPKSSVYSYCAQICERRMINLLRTRGTRFAVIEPKKIRKLSPGRRDVQRKEKSSTQLPATFLLQICLSKT